MNITFEELRRIKHQLPTGSVKKIAERLDIDQQTVRNFFGANKFGDGDFVGKHIQPGPKGGIVNITDDTILTEAKRIIHEVQFAAS
ncbi:MAG: DNA-binding protein [Bacteroidota bacterium]